MITKPLHIGDLTLGHFAIAAPMAGLSLPAFRKLIMELGCGLAYSEMVSADGVIYANSKTKHYYDNSIAARPYGVQLFTSKPDMLAEAIEYIESQSPSPLPLSRQGRGNKESPQNSAGVDLFDINMGCPVKKVVKRGAGTALMKTPKLAAQLIEAAKKATDKPVTVKMRAGWDEDSINCIEFARMAEGSGADAVIIHPRTRAQEFGGTARWELIGDVKESVKIPVIGNGDIKTADDANRMMEETGCDAVMIGRAAYRNPWIFAELNKSPLLCPPEADQPLADKEGLWEVESDEKRKFLLRYIDLLNDTYEERIVICTMRAFLSRFAKGYEGVSKFLARAYRLDTISELKDEIGSYDFKPVYS